MFNAYTDAIKISCKLHEEEVRMKAALDENSDRPSLVMLYIQNM